MGSTSFSCKRCIAHWLGKLEPERLLLLCSTLFGSLVSHMISLLTFMALEFAIGKRILPLHLLVFYSQLITQLSALSMVHGFYYYLSSL